MESLIKVTPIMPEDLVEVMELCKQSHEGSMWAHLPFSPERVRRNIILFMVNDDYFAIKATLGDRIIGFHFGQRGETTFSDVPLGVERGLYVAKKSRGTRAFVMMVGEFCKWCDERGLTGPDYIIYHSKDNKRAYAACEKLGMVERGRIYEYERTVH